MNNHLRYRLDKLIFVVLISALTLGCAEQVKPETPENGVTENEPQQPSIEAEEDANARVTVFPNTLRIVNDASLLERNRYFNICSSGTDVYDQNVLGEADYLINRVNISFGRRLGHMHYQRDQFKEDSERPGYADVDSIYEVLSEHLVDDDPRLVESFGDNMDVILHGRSLELPDFIEQKDDDTPINLEAAAEYLVEGLKARYTDFTRPRYYELINEPKFPVYTHPEFHKLHAEVAKRVREKELDVLVGGPCLAIAYFYRDNYTQGYWRSGILEFLSNAGRDIDFLSFHVYDFYHGLREGRTTDIITGLPLEQVFDVIAAYSTRELGRVLPVGISEQGATGNDFWVEEGRGDPRHGAEVSRSLLLWRHMNSSNGQVMTYMDQPVIKAVPFTLYTTDWNPLYVRVLYERDDFDTSKPFVSTDAIMFYQLWQDVKGHRLRAHSSDPDIQARAFIHNDKMYLALNNLAPVEKAVDLELNSEDVPQMVTISRFFLAGEKPQLERDLQLPNYRELTLSSDETVILTFKYHDILELERAVDEKTYYGEAITVPIRARQQHQFQVDVPASETVEYAYLRIGITRPHGLAWTPTVTLNGEELKVPAAESDKVQLNSPEYATTKIIPVPLKLLEDENKVRVRYNDQGGVIASVAIRTGKTAEAL